MDGKVGSISGNTGSGLGGSVGDDIFGGLGSARGSTEGSTGSDRGDNVRGGIFGGLRSGLGSDGISSNVGSGIFSGLENRQGRGLGSISESRGSGIDDSSPFPDGQTLNGLLGSLSRPSVPFERTGDRTDSVPAPGGPTLEGLLHSLSGSSARNGTGDSISTFGGPMSDEPSHALFGSSEHRNRTGDDNPMHKGQMLHGLLRHAFEQEVWIIGGAFLEHFVTIFDFDKARVGFAEPAVDAQVLSPSTLNELPSSLDRLPADSPAVGRGLPAWSAFAVSATIAGFALLSLRACGRVGERRIDFAALVETADEFDQVA